MPLLTKSAVTWLASKDAVDGQPGTEAIPAPNNDIPRDRLAVGDGQAYARDFGGSWYPSIYYQASYGFPPSDRGVAFPAGGNDAGVAVYSDNQIPVPAIDPTLGRPRLVHGLGARTVTAAQPSTSAQPRPRRRVSRRHA
jgi:hypothetical protein